MAIEFFTGFEGCNSTEDVLTLLDVTGGSVRYQSTGGYDDGKNVGTSNTAGFIGKNVTPAKTVCTGWHVRSLGTSSYSTSTRLNIAYFVGPEIRIVNDPEQVEVWVAGVLVGSEAPAIDSALHHIEVKLFSDAAAGTAQIKLDGTLILDLSGINTGGDDVTQVCLGQSNVNNRDIYWDNWFIADDFQGELVSHLLIPATDAAVQFTPSEGTDNYPLLPTNDGDASYVQSSTVDHQDLYGYSELPAGLIPRAATLVTVPRKEGTGERTFQARAKQDLTEYAVGEDRTLTVDYPAALGQGLFKTFGAALDGTPWNRDNLNAVQWGFKVTG